jgi:DNA-binding CsgD family transcriptional regulator
MNSKQKYGWVSEVKLMEGNDWIFLNSIIYKIHSTEDITKMQRTFLELIKLLIPYDVATFYLAEVDSSHLLGHPVGVNVSEDDLQEYTDQFEEIDYTRWVFISARSMAYRETDLFPDDIREATDLYKEMYEPNNIHFSAQLSIVHNEVFLGIVSLYRAKDKEDFSERDLFVLDMVKDHLAYRLFMASKIETIVKTSKQDVDLSSYASQFGLTQRETEVFQLLFGDLTDGDICKTLFIGPNTLKKHILSIYKKAGVKSRIQLFKLAK